MYVHMYDLFVLTSFENYGCMDYEEDLRLPLVILRTCDTLDLDMEVWHFKLTKICKEDLLLIPMCIYICT